MSRPRIAAFVLLLSALGFLAGVLAGRQIELNQADDRLAGHNARLLAHALRVAQEGHRLMAAAPQGGAQCAEADVAIDNDAAITSTGTPTRCISSDPNYDVIL